MLRELPPEAVVELVLIDADMTGRILGALTSHPASGSHSGILKRVSFTKPSVAMLVRSLRNRGLGSTLRTIRVYAGGALFDLRYGVRTNRWVHRTDLEVVGNNKDNAIEYQPIRVLVFRDAFNSFQIQPDGVFVDFGSAWIHH